MTQFARYARYYDAVYDEKPYARECDVVEQVVATALGPGPWRILDAGCGTGSHAVELARRDHDVTGVDRSDAMLEVARSKPDARDVRFVQGDIRTLDLGETFDVAVCLFGVLSYQLTPADTAAALRSLRAHLQPGGILAVDYWYGPAVLIIGPTAKQREWTDGHRRVVRTATPLGVEVPAQTNATRYTLRVYEGDALADEVEEVHIVRFFHPGEMERYTADAGFEVLHCFADWDPATPLHDRAWVAVLVAQAR